jgi:hypothetical protein
MRLRLIERDIIGRLLNGHRNASYTKVPWVRAQPHHPTRCWVASVHEALGDLHHEAVVQEAAVHPTRASPRVSMHTDSHGANSDRGLCQNCVRYPLNSGRTPRVTGTRRSRSLLREVVDQKCVGGVCCASARVKRSDFQACLIDRSSISPSLESYTCGRPFQQL